MLCSYPGCKTGASKSWALAPVCALHHELIRIEVNKHYTSDTTMRRMHYKAILPHTFLGGHKAKGIVRGKQDMLSWTGVDRV